MKLDRPMLVLLAAALAAGAAHAQAVAPLDFELSDGHRFIKLAEMPSRLTVVNFWRVDCPPCLTEMPHLAAWARNGKARVVTIALHRPTETLSARSAVLDALRPPVLALRGPSDPRGLLARFGNPAGALPFTVVLDTQRLPCARHIGEVDGAWLDAAQARCSNTEHFR